MLDLRGLRAAPFGMPLQKMDLNTLSHNAFSESMSGRWSTGDAWAMYSVSGATQEVFDDVDKGEPLAITSICIIATSN